MTTDVIGDKATLPHNSEVVVIGGGIIGVCTALELQKRGMQVTLCEKGQIAGEQSSRNWGWCRVTNRDVRELELAIEGVRMWRCLNEEYGIDTGYQECGILYATSDDVKLGAYCDWLERARDVAGDTFDTRVVNASQIAKILSGSSQSFTGGIFTPGDGRAEPSKAVPELANALIRLKGNVLTNCAVRGIETSGGRVSAVVTERGTIRCEAVVIAAGAWSRLFCGNADVDLPQLLLRSSVSRTVPIADGPTCSANCDNVAFRKRLDGGYTIASGFSTDCEVTPDSFRLFLRYFEALKTQRTGLRLRFGRRFFEELARRRRWPLDKPTVFETVRTLNPIARSTDTERGLKEFVRLFPKLANTQIAHSWGGYIDVTPDALPVISDVSRIPGLYIGTGFSGHGFGIGPSAGRLLADLVANKKPFINAHAFRLTRFTDGSKLEIHN